MTNEELTLQARRECCSEATTAHHGGGYGRPFWNAEAFQFMYVPSFQFQPIPECKKYRFTAKDENGKIHTFDAPKPSALLTEIWGDIPEGIVELTVRTVNDDGSEGLLAGARTFYKLSPFSTDLPKAKCSYKECAAKAFDYIMNLDFIHYWLDHDVPDPSYGLNVYPSKTLSAVINAMLKFTSVFPEKADDALKIATKAANHLLKITYRNNSVMNGVPPTYKLDFREDYKEHYAGSIMEARCNTVMELYPAYVGTAYLLLEEKINDSKYFDAAIKIGEHYLNTVQENGSWYLVRSCETGEPLNLNYCDPLPNIVPFLMKLYKRTGDEKWKALSDNAIAYVEKNALVHYNWEGQFEDSTISSNYSNLTHYGASALIRHYTEYYPHDERKMEIADNLMRFIEDQFVLWGKPCPWQKGTPSQWHTPCGLEQYVWHVPIDASTSNIAMTFLAMYKAGRGELHLAKAKALIDSITRIQHDDGMIPTHWMDEDTIKGENFWVNCMIATANAIETMAEFIEEN